MPEWFSSIRSLTTLMVAGTFCYMAVMGKVDAKDMMLIVSLIFNFYFLVKDRTGNGDQKPEVKP